MNVPENRAIERWLASRGIPASQVPLLLAPPPPTVVDLPGLEAAVAFVRARISDRQPILLFGDYDVDGLTAAVLLAEAIEALGGEVSIRIPNRLTEGYGLSKEVVEEAAELGAALLTVDSGITAVAEAELAERLGVPLCITDHHEPGEVLPRAVLLNPKLAVDPLPLAGSGVAWVLASALLGVPWQPGYALAALGTLADQVSVLGWNRGLIRQGSAAGVWSERAGIAALGRRCNADPNRSLRSRQVAFQLAPRLNAAGRMGQSELALAVLRAGPEEAERLVDRLEALNDERRQIQEAMEQEALRLAEAYDGQGVLLVMADASSRWHRGLLGIVAARVAERLRRPTLVAVRQGELVHASARGPETVDLLDLLTPLRAWTTRFGGHRQALGCTFAAKHVPRVVRLLRELPVPDTAEDRCLDTYLLPTDWQEDLVDELEAFEPFGPDLPEPIFGLPYARVEGMGGIGSRGGVSFRVEGVPAVAWQGLPDAPRLRLSFRLERDPWGNARFHVVTSEASAWWEWLRQAAKEAPFPWGVPAGIGGTPLAGRLPDAPGIVVVSHLAWLEMLARCWALAPLYAAQDEDVVRQLELDVREGRLAGMVAYRPPSYLPRLPLYVVSPFNPAQLAAFQARGAGLVAVVRWDEEEPPPITDVERLRDVVRALRRGERFDDPIRLGFAEQVFAELGLDPHTTGRVELRHSQHYRRWLEHEESRRLMMARHGSG